MRRARVYRALLSAGLSSYGLVHLVVGVVALYLAFGQEVDASYADALGIVARRPLGGVLIWVMAVGLGALTVWQVGWALTWRDRSERWTRPVAALGRAATYAVLAVLALLTIWSSGEPVPASTALSARLLARDPGRALVAAVGCGVGAAGVAKVVRGIRRTFVEDLARRSGPATVVLGVVGHIAKGLVLVVVGLLLLAAALTQDPTDLGGTALALASMRRGVVGFALLIGIAGGLGCFGLYCLVWSTRPRIH